MNAIKPTLITEQPIRNEEAKVGISVIDKEVEHHNGKRLVETKKNNKFSPDLPKQFATKLRNTMITKITDVGIRIENAFILKDESPFSIKAPKIKGKTKNSKKGTK